MKIAALPKDPNPYQELLYKPMRRAGVPVVYVGEATPSRTLNQLLLPLELVWRRLNGFRILHVHWLFGFRFIGSERSPVVLRLSRMWFGLVTRTAKALGYRLVWTAHNVLPHWPIFDDDLAARRLLVQSCDLVIVHAPNALEGLERLGLSPRRSAVIPPGSYDLPQFAVLPEPPVRPPTAVLWFGQVVEYKGIEELLSAVLTLTAELHIVVAGSCPSPDLRQRLEQQAARMPGRVTLLLRYIADDEIAPLFEQAHAVVLPFRAVTTSSSVMLAMASGRPVIVPDLPAFAELPNGAVIRYPPGMEGLREALQQLPATPAETLLGTGRAGRAIAIGDTWEEIARRTLTALRELELAR